MPLIDRDVCRLCLADDPVLTREHIPPQSAGNAGPHQLYAIAFDGGGQREIDLHDGFSLSVLCQSCNTRYGSRLGTTFAGFVQQVQRSGRFISPRGGVFALTMDVYPARVYRQLLLNYLCIHPASDDSKWMTIREFIKSRDTSTQTELPTIGLYCNVSTTYRVVPVGSLGSLGNLGEPWLGAEIAAPGLGVVFSIDSSRDVYLPIKPKVTDISDWAREPFAASQKVLLELPRHRVETAYPLGFGTPAEVDKWQERYHVMWLSTRFDVGGSTSVGAILWKPSRRDHQRRRGRRSV